MGFDTEQFPIFRGIPSVRGWALLKLVDVLEAFNKAERLQFSSCFQGLHFLSLQS